MTAGSNPVGRSFAVRMLGALTVVPLLMVLTGIVGVLLLPLMAYDLLAQSDYFGRAFGQWVDEVVEPIMDAVLDAAP